MTKLNKEHYEHFLNGGYFKAIYNPTEFNIPYESQRLINNEIIVYPNVVMHPSDDGRYYFQMQFDSQDIYGWIPEEDLTILEIINDYHPYRDEYEMTFYKKNESYPTCHCYRLKYSTQKQIDGNFGKTSFKPPFTVYRHYSWDRDDYVIRLSKPQADSIEKTTWVYGQQDLNWESII